MPASTSPLAFPYPIAADAPAGHTQMQALATAAQTAIGSVAAGLQEGVIDASFEVTQASGGASMVLDTASNVGSGCYVDDDGLSPARVARYYVPPTAAKSTVTVATAHATLPRVDAVVVSMAGVVSIVTGTATSGATLDNARDGSHGGAAIPSDALHLADALVPATDTTISNSQIRDRRKWARGAFYSISDATSATRTSTTLAEITSALSARIECSGAPVLARLSTVWGPSVADKGAKFDVFMDGTGILNTTGGFALDTAPTITADSGGGGCAFSYEWIVTPAAGSHVFTPAFASKDGTTTITILPYANQRSIFTVQEMVRQNSKNNATTSG